MVCCKWKIFQYKNSDSNVEICYFKLYQEVFNVVIYFLFHNVGLFRLFDLEDYENAENKLEEIENEVATSAASDAEKAKLVVGKRITKKRHLEGFYSDNSTDDEVIPIPPKIRKDSQKNKQSPRCHGSEQSQASGSGILRGIIPKYITLLITIHHILSYILELSQTQLSLRKPVFSSQSEYL